MQIEGMHAAIGLQLADAVRAGGGEFVQPVVTVDDHGRLAAQLAQHARQRLGQRRVINSGQLVSGAGRVSERPEDVEDGALFQFAPRSDCVLHGGMEAGREHETDADCVDAGGDLFRGQVH